MERKRSFDIDVMLSRVRDAVAEFADAAMFDLAQRGYGGVFQQLVSCIISIRTFDEVSLPAAMRLFERAGDARAVSALSKGEIDVLIHPATFHTRKAEQIRDIARLTVERYGGELPCDFEVLTSFAGVGPKCAGLALGVACGASHIAVDVHVHRVTNRWGYVDAATPDLTMRALMERLPRQHWIEINRLLVPFGKHVCTGRNPKCTTCPVLSYCRQVGVTSHR